MPSRPLVVADMPFGSYQVSDERRGRATPVRFVKERAPTPSSSRGRATLSRVEAIVGAGIPVMGHIGLTPQSATALGGYKAQGRTAERRAGCSADALALQEAGCYSLVLEAVPTPVAARHHRPLDDPDHRHRRRVGCDGQVLVYHDLLGLYDGAPRFVKRYADLATIIREALASFAADVRSGAYPEERHTYGMPADELDAFRAIVGADRALEADR